MKRLEAGRDRARLAIQHQMRLNGIPDLDAILGSGGTRRLLDGGWPTDLQIQQIELKLQWPYRTVQAIVDRPALTELSGLEHAMVTLVHHMPDPERRALLELLKVTSHRTRTRPDTLRLINGGTT